MNEFFKFYIYVNYGLHHLLVETSHKGFSKYIDDMSNEFTIHKDREGNKLTVWIENYYGDRDDLGFIVEKE